MTDPRTAGRKALAAARRYVRQHGGRKRFSLGKRGRVLPLPDKKGGFLPMLLPIFTGLAALGSIAGGGAAVAKAINEAHAAKQQLAEDRRHNRAMEELPLRSGRGVRLALMRRKRGYGLRIEPTASKNL